MKKIIYIIGGICWLMITLTFFLGIEISQISAMFSSLFLGLILVVIGLFES